MSPLARLLIVLPLAVGAVAAQAGSTVYSSGSGVAIVSGTGISSGGDLVAGKGPLKAEERQTAAYRGIVLEAPVLMAYAAGKAPAMRVTAQANILPLVTTEVKGGRLVVGLKKSIRVDHPIRIEAAGPSLETIALPGSGELQVTGQTGRKLDLDISGSGSVALAGQVDSLAIDISGSGDVAAAALAAREAKVDVSGSGTVAVHATAAVAIDLSGSGDITVTGKPRQRSVEKSGAGEVVFR